MNPRLPLLMAFLFSYPGWGADLVFQLHLQAADRGISPAVVYLESEGGQVRAGALLTPYRPVRSSPTYFWGSQDFVELDVSGLRVENGALSGSARGEGLQLTLRTQGDEALIHGTYEGQIAGKAVEGPLLGVVSPRLPPEEADKAILYLTTPHPGQNNEARYNGAGIRATVVLDLVQGRPTQATFFVQPHSSVYGARTQVAPRVPVGGGRAASLVFGPNARLVARRVEGNVKDRELHIDLVAEAPEKGEITYRIRVRMLGDTLLGDYVLVEDGLETPHRNAVTGHIGKTGAMAGKPNVPADADGLGAALLGHLNWLFDNPYCGGLFGSDPNLSRTGCTGDKQYDNPPMAGASAPIAMSLLATLGEDPLVRTHALLAAQRGGHYLVSRRGGATRTPETYKNMFWMNYWMGRAFLDLHGATGDAYWLERAKELADTLRRVQLDSGSWNWVDRDGKTGVSNRRHNRDWDNISLQCGDWLHFLGRLRVEAGVIDYLDVERKAAAWMRKAVEEGVEHQGVKYLWQERGGGSGENEAGGPTFYSLYLLDYAEDFDPAHMQKVLDWVEANLVDRSDPAKPFVRDFQPRSPPGFHAAATLRHALVNLKAAEKTGEESYRQRAAQFLNTVLGMRDETTGAIWGARPPADWTAYARTFQHPYTAYQAELAANLFEFSRLDAAAEKAGRAQPQAQRLHVGKIAPHAAAPARIPLEIEATSGLAPRIDVVSGPATVEGNHVLLSGEAGIVVLRITQDGDTLFLPATPVEIPFAVGDVRPAPAQGLTGQALDMETFRLSWETGAMDLAGFRVESAPADGGAWTTLATVGPQSTRHEFPAGGAGPWFRVIAFNPVMDAEPSAAIRVEPLAREIRITLAPAEAAAGKDWELRDFDDAPGGRAWVPLSHTIRDGPTEDQTFSYEVELDGPPGRYHVHYLCWGNAGSNDSAWFRLEGQPWHPISITNAGQWQWRSATFEIRETGKHRISFGARQSTTAKGTPAPRIATVLVTNGPRPD